MSVFINRVYCWVAREALNKTKNGWPHPQHMMDIMVHTSKVSWINYFSNRQLPLHKYEYEHLHLNNSSRTRSGRLSLVWKLHFPPHSNNHSSNWDQYLDLELLIPTKGGSQNRADKSDRKKNYGVYRMMIECYMSLWVLYGTIAWCFRFWFGVSFSLTRWTIYRVKLDSNVNPTSSRILLCQPTQLLIPHTIPI